MKRKPPPLPPPGEVPPLELLRCPWTRWNDRREERFGEWLQERQRWRETHPQPLPGLFARDRFALSRLSEQGALDPEVVRAEQTADRAAPEWRQKQLVRGITDPRQVLSKTYNDELDRGADF